MLATLPARIASDGLDPNVANAIAASLRAYLTVTRLTDQAAAPLAGVRQVSFMTPPPAQAEPARA